MFSRNPLGIGMSSLCALGYRGRHIMSGCAGFTSFSLHFDVTPVRAQSSVNFQTTFSSSLEFLNLARYTPGSVCCRRFIVVLVIVTSIVIVTSTSLLTLYTISSQLV